MSIKNAIFFIICLLNSHCIPHGSCFRFSTLFNFQSYDISLTLRDDSCTSCPCHPAWAPAAFLPLSSDGSAVTLSPLLLILLYLHLFLFPSITAQKCISSISMTKLSLVLSVPLFFNLLHKIFQSVISFISYLHLCASFSSFCRLAQFFLFLKTGLMGRLGGLVV